MATDTGEQNRKERCLKDMVRPREDQPKDIRDVNSCENEHVPDSATLAAGEEQRQPQHTEDEYVPDPVSALTRRNKTDRKTTLTLVSPNRNRDWT